MVRILHINSYYSNSKFYKNLYDEQVAMGMDIDVFIPVSKSYKDKEFDYGSYANIRINHGKYDRAIFHLKHRKILKDVINQYEVADYDLLHAHSMFSNGYIAMKLNEHFSVPYILAVRNSDVNTFFKKMIHLRRIGIRILYNAKSIIFLSKPYKDFVINKYIPENIKREINNKSIVVTNGIDDFWLQNQGLPKNINGKLTFRLLQVGDINKNKNILITVKSIMSLEKKGYKVNLDVVGKVKNKAIYNKIKNLPSVNFIGFKTKKELIKIYRDNDIMLAPSIYETFGLVYAEAMSQGLAVIYSKNQGFDGQFKQGEIGYSVDCMSSEDIVSAIRKIIDDYSNISIRALTESKRYNWKTISKVYYEIYMKFVKDTGR